MALNPKLGIIAGNGRFPFLVLDAARAQGAQGYEVVVAAIKEETSPEIELSAQPCISIAPALCLCYTVPSA